LVKYNGIVGRSLILEGVFFNLAALGEILRKFWGQLPCLIKFELKWKLFILLIGSKEFLSAYRLIKLIPSPFHSI
jgi:hypothetical protein